MRPWQACSLALRGKQLAADNAAVEPLQLAPAVDKDAAAAAETAVDIEVAAVAADVDIAVVLETQLHGDSSCLGLR